MLEVHPQGGVILSAEVNVFVSGGHVKVLVPDAFVLDSDSNAVPLPPSAADLMGLLKDLQDAAVAVGLTMDTRGPSSAPAAGPGAAPAKAEDQAPAGVTPPEHCGVPMEFKPAFHNRKTGNDVSAKWQCGRGTDCSDVKNGGKYPASIWADKWEG